MRKVFASQRLENVEAVAKLLEQDGIEVRIEHPRSFRSAIRGNFSYLDDGKRNPPQPAVWVVRSDDQPRARALMREAGLLQDTTRDPAIGLNFAAPSQTPAKKRISRLCYGLLALALVIVVVNFIRRPDEAPVAANTATSADTPALRMLDEPVNASGERYVIATPPLLAVLLARRALDADPAARTLCLAIDGDDPAETAFTALAAAGIKAHADSACPSGEALRLDVYGYTTDGSGTGEVNLTLRMGTHASTETVRVRRTDAAWAVLDDGR